jgi:hypothetical protein
MALPDFLLIGAMKCGTSTLAAQLGAQPGLFMTTPKEPNFFSDDAVFALGRGWYEGLFAAAEPGDLKGEASTHYTKLPTYPETLTRMRAVLQSPRLVYMIRDPVDRAVSHYIHEWTEGRMSADPVSAFEQHPELIDYGRYAMQIAPFVAAYGAQAILITSLERLKADPGGELGRVCSHIGMTTPPVWRPDLGARNVSAERIRKLPLHGLLVANPVARTLRRALVPRALRARIRQARAYGARPELPDGLRMRLAAIFAEDRARILEMNLAGAADALSQPARPGSPDRALQTAT